jgi:secondary thiamine-phosphate synthase enzyme
MIRHQIMELPPYPRGFHLITEQVLDALGPLPELGLLHLFIRHTSAALAVNEGADPSVLRDFARVFDHLVPEDLPFLEHTVEGPDDMPAHIKAVFAGASVSIPIAGGKLALGTWQGIYLCEFRNRGGQRSIMASLLT